MTAEGRARELIVMHGQSLHARGLTPGASGNLSVRVDDVILVTPTNSCIGRLDPDDIALVDAEGRHVSGKKPSKESFLHRAFYRRNPNACAVVHLHSHAAVALSCMRNLDRERPVRPLTPYFVMKLGRLKVLPYFPPGDAGLARAVEAVADRYRAVLLSNHGPVVAGRSLDAAVYAVEELEAAARLQLDLDGRDARELSADEIETLEHRFTD